MFLTNNKNTLGLYEWLKARMAVHIFSEPVVREQVAELKPDLIVSYNYNYLIGRDVIQYMEQKVINLHISLLPWNRGASPNIWSFVDGTPKGVTIHQVNEGLDKGNILYQRKCFFDEKVETFENTYYQLHKEIQDLFKEKWEEIMSMEWPLKEPIEKGSYHSQKDLFELQKTVPFHWSDNIAKFLERYRRTKMLLEEKG